MQAFLAAVREACSPTLWSRGVQLQRAGMVLGQLRRGDALEVRVGTPGGRNMPFTVSLFIDAQDWSCDCDGPVDDDSDACAHVAAAAIALRHGGTSDAAPSATPPPGVAVPRRPPAVKTLAYLAYDWRRQGHALALQRLCIRDGSPPQPIASLSAPTGVALRPLDHAVERALRGYASGPLPPGLAAAALAAMQNSDAVRLDGRPIAVGPARPNRQLRLSRRPEGLWVQAVGRGGASERFVNGVVRLGNSLHAEVPVALPPAQLEALQRGQLVPPAQLGKFREQLLPRLQAALPLAGAEEALPPEVAVPLRLQVETFGSDEPQGAPLDGFWTRTSLTYAPVGAAACAQLEGDELIYLHGPYPRRDRPAEAHLRAQAEALGLRFGPRQLFLGAAALAMADALRQHDLGGPAALAASATFASTAQLQPQIDYRQGALEVHFELPAVAGGVAAGRASAEAVLRAWSCNSPLVQLLDGRFVPQPQAFLVQHGELLRDLLAARQEKGALPPAARRVAAQLFDDLAQPLPADLAPLLAAFGKDGKLQAVALAPPLAALLRPYQQDGVNWLAALRDAQLGGLLADDMGLGKTLQTLCCFLPGKKTLVVAPTSVLHNWAAELQRFRPELRVHLYHGSRRALQPQSDVTLTTYGVMRLDAESLSAHPWAILVLDEAQNIKNPHSQLARAARRLPAHCRLALCGTPMENKLEELWSHFEFLNPGHLGTLEEFLQRYARPIAAGQAGVAQRLQKQIRPFFLRRKKSEVARDLPPRTEQVMRCVLSAREREVYEGIRAVAVPAILQQLQAGGNVMQALETLLRLRQACTHPLLVPGVQAETSLPSAKLNALCEALGELVEQGHKAIVFSQWTGFLDLIEPALRRLGMAFLRLDGSTRDRQGVVQAFAAADGPPVFLISLKAGGTGLNLIAADHVFLMDPWWNPAVEDQAADRAHRIGQTRPVFVHKVIAQDTVEEKILALQAAKRALVGATLDGLDRAPQLSRDDLAQLLT